MISHNLQILQNKSLSHPSSFLQWQNNRIYERCGCIIIRLWHYLKDIAINKTRNCRLRSYCKYIKLGSRIKKIIINWLLLERSNAEEKETDIFLSILALTLSIVFSSGESNWTSLITFVYYVQSGWLGGQD